MTIQEARKLLTGNLAGIYDSGEAENISDWVIEHVTGFDKKSCMADPNTVLSTPQVEQLQKATARLITQEPVQYVLNESWFCGFKFYVDNNVLIPRPETEELVEWIISNLKFPLQKFNILDIGTGSGCIAISLKRKIRKAGVWGCDISDAALNIARLNAETLGAEINFLHIDFLNTSERNSLPAFDIIVSNPPYVPQKDKKQMHSNVLDYEPHTALFVPDNDPLIFYKAIADFGKTHLAATGSIFLEIHEDFGQDVKSLFLSKGYLTAEIKKDMQERERMMRIV
ncbi:MAG: Release factor glutamine methyltransferase [Chitinophagaceae bacterium]|nr:Release factor glutamine methyltransferase [Chitinophagaceae bacterium]